MYPQTPIHMLIPSASECGWVWRWGLQRGNYIEMRSLRWTLIQHDWCLYKKRRLDTDTEGRPHEDAGRGLPNCKQKREASEENNPADTLISDFQPPDREKVDFCRFNPPAWGILLWQP